MEKHQSLLFALSLSIALNIALLAPKASPFFFSSQIERPEDRLRDAFQTMERLSFAEQLSFLTNQEVVCPPFSKRDLALSLMVGQHDFNLEQALKYKPQPIEGLGRVPLYHGLDEKAFDAIIQFAYLEKWPFTAKGLFRLLEEQKEVRDESLMQAFFATAEFRKIAALFERQQTPETLLSLVIEGGWDHLFRSCQKEGLSLVEMRRHYLVGAIANRSSMAAQLLLKREFEYALQLEDSQLISLLTVIRETGIAPISQANASKSGQSVTPDFANREAANMKLHIGNERFTKDGVINCPDWPQECERWGGDAYSFCIALLSQQRSDAVLFPAAHLLYLFAKEVPPVDVDLQLVKDRFLPKTALLRQHVVQEGESLWKIAREYKVSVNDLISVNELKKDQLYPGMILILP